MHGYAVVKWRWLTESNGRQVVIDFVVGVLEWRKVITDTLQVEGSLGNGADSVKAS